MAMNIKFRKCKIIYGKEERLYYFHGWTQEGMTKFHGEDPQRDSTYVATLAIVEDIQTGKVHTTKPSYITFID